VAAAVGEIPAAVAAVEISTSEVTAVSETTATAAEMAAAHAAAPATHTNAATATMAATAATSAAFGEGVMGDRDAAESENRHAGRNFVKD
jgi:hypothetical protein